MSCCKRTNETEQFSCTGVYVNDCALQKKKCSIPDAAIHFCLCQNNEESFACTNTCNTCNTCHPTSIVNTCCNTCQCVEEMIWNSNKPPKPDCKWLSNFSELRRQWSNHARRQNCKCCNCK